MKKLSQSEKSKAFITVIATIGCLALSPIARAVVPPPDGGYANFTTAEGQNALFSLTSGAANTAVGWFSLKSVTTGSFNTGVGAGTLVLNTGDANTATGTAALLLNTTGQRNTANGTAALVNNSTGEDNTAVGAFALNSNTATGNTAIGSNALLDNTTGGTLGNIQGFDVGPNVALGSQALESNTVASANTAVGYQALHSFTTGPVGFEQIGLCTAVGFQALGNATGGFGNNAFGYQALLNNAGGAANNAIGHFALSANTTGSSNVAIGGIALNHNIGGDANIATGFGALQNNTDGSNNIAMGLNSLSANMTSDNNTAIGASALQGSAGSGNTALGHDSGAAVGTANNVICIGTQGANVDNSCYIGNIFGATSPGGVTVLVNSDGKLGTIVSSRRFKEDIKSMDKASEAILALQPVTFRYIKEFDPAGASQFGLVAEDVEKVNSDLVVHDKEGKPYSVRYDQVNAMLLNEFLKQHDAFLKEHRKVEKLEGTVARQQQGMEALAAQVKEQAGQIQKVSAEIELNKSVARVAEAGQ
jgi:hypothetical protein